MTQLIQATTKFRRPAFEAQPSMAPDKRLRRQSRILSWMFLATFVVMAVIDIAEVSVLAMRAGALSGIMNGSFAFVLDFPPFSESADALPAAFIPVSRLLVWQSAMAASLLALRLLPGLVILASLFLLFRMYAGGMIFTRGNTAHIRRIAWAMLAYSTVPLITHAALFATGLSDVAIKLEVRQLDAAVTGMILFAVARVMSFGSEIDRDREGFV